jgi:hypothetical protein
MLYHPEFFPGAKGLITLAVRPLGPRATRGDWLTQRVIAPVWRAQAREWRRGTADLDQVERTIQYGWWLMTYTHLLGVTIDPSYIINGTSTNKEN